MSVDVSQIPVNDATNFLVPSSGGVHSLQVELELVANVPQSIDFRQLANANFPFQPQGVYVDNSQGSATCTIGISANGGANFVWTVQVKAGDMAAFHFPAPNGQYHVINGTGDVNLVYVDYPVIPYSYTP